jgi:hypothetical protein
MWFGTVSVGCLMSDTAIALLFTALAKGQRICAYR